MSWNRALLMYEKSGHPEWSGVDSCKLFMSSLLPEFMASKVSIDEAKLDAAKEVHGDDFDAMLKEMMEDHGRECTHARFTALIDHSVNYSVTPVHLRMNWFF